jgi:1-acylglycerone phosphate reductase
MNRIRQMYDTNVFGLFNMVTAFTPLLLAAASGSTRPPIIINTASVVAVLPYPFSSAYNASKAAVASYSDALRVELAPLGIKVVTLYMGVVSTGISSPERIKFEPNSIYADAEAGVRQRSKDHQDTGMKVDQFAKLVVTEVLDKHGLGQGELIWKGTNAFLVWLLNSLGARKILLNANAKEIGFDDDMKQKITQKGRAAIQKN